MSAGRLTGKLAVITGATSGVGLAIARRFAAEGADLLLTGRRSERAQEVLEELRAAAGSVEFVLGDIRSESVIAEIASTARASHGRIDSLVLNAGVIAYGPTLDISLDDFDEIMSVNVRAPWLCVRGLHQLLPDGATIIGIGSISSFVAYSGESIYCMSKAALIQLVRALAVELADRRIRVNALCPGVIADGGMSQDAIDASADPAGELARSNAATPLGRPGLLTEIASGAVFLASDDSSYMTGSSLVLDGGMIIPRV